MNKKEIEDGLIASVIFAVGGVLIAMNITVQDNVFAKISNDFHAEVAWGSYILEHISNEIAGDWYWLKALAGVLAIFSFLGGGFYFIVCLIKYTVYMTSSTTAPDSQLPQQEVLSALSGQLVCPQCQEPVPGNFCLKHGIRGVPKSK